MTSACFGCPVKLTGRSNVFAVQRAITTAGRPFGQLPGETYARLRLRLTGGGQSLVQGSVFKAIPNVTRNDDVLVGENAAAFQQLGHAKSTHYTSGDLPPESWVGSQSHRKVKTRDQFLVAHGL